MNTLTSINNACRRSLPGAEDQALQGTETFQSTR